MSNTITAGLYSLESPYHKGNVKLPFLIQSDGYVRTIEYKGKTAYKANGYFGSPMGTVKQCKMIFICDYQTAQTEIWNKKIVDLMIKLNKAKDNE